MSENWLHHFEGRLEQLERTANDPQSAFSDVVNASIASLECLAGVTGQEIYLVRPEQIERLACDGNINAVTVESDDEIAAAKDHRTQVLKPDASHTSDRLLVTRPLADSLFCVLRLNYDDSIAPQASFVDGTAVVLDIVSGFVSRVLLSQYEAGLQTQTQLTNLTATLYACQTPQEAAAALVHDGPAIVGDCRMTVAMAREGRLRVAAVTGIPELTPDSATVRALEDVIADCADTGEFDRWHALPPADDRSSQSSWRVLADNGTNRLSAFSLVLDPPASTTNEPSAVLVVEAFRADVMLNDSSIRQLVSLAAPVFERLNQNRRTGFRRLAGNRRNRSVLAALAALLLLSLIPTNFEIEVPGQMTSVDCRRVFAPENGTIDEVLFQNEEAVGSEQPLLQLSNPDLDLGTQRVQGAIDTTTAELASIRARRLSQSDPQLSSDERQLQQRLQSLQQELKLILQQVSSLTVTSPIAGVVYHRDPHRELMARPVQRGQLLLEVVPADSQWQLELKIPDEVRPYVVRHRVSSGDSQAVRYMLVSMPEQDWTTTLTNVDNAVQVDDNKLVCRGTATLTTLPDTVLRPGTSVVARIDCGRRSLVFVMFREVVEFWNRLSFAWF